MAENQRQDPALDAPEAVDPSDAPEAPDVAESPEVLALRQERDDYYDRLLRKTAEFDNYRKRVERERREQADQAVVDLLLDLLTVVDDFERALSVEESGDEGGAAAYRRGVELIHAKLQEVLRKRGVQPIETAGADFDPNLHQAVAHEASEGRREGEVIGELRRGYMMGDRLLRPAMVKVAKA
jgi:molecular chaperone GrpE